MDHQTKLENFYMSLEEPLRGTLLFLRKEILGLNENLNESWKYGMPFFCYGKKMFCYFWFDKKDKSKPYISFAEGRQMEHPLLEMGSRKRMKALRFYPHQDLPITAIRNVLHSALQAAQAS